MGIILDALERGEHNAYPTFLLGAAKWLNAKT